MAAKRQENAPCET